MNQNDLMEVSAVVVEEGTVDLELLNELETKIANGIASLYEMGKALQQIKQQRLYRLNYPTFESYCRERWGISQIRAWQLIAHTQVIDNLSQEFDVLPENEYQSRSLQKLSPSDQALVWGEVIKQTPKPTNKIVKRVVEETIAARQEPSPEPIVKRSLNPEPIETITVTAIDTDRVTGDQIVELFLTLSPVYRKVVLDQLTLLV